MYNDLVYHLDLCTMAYQLYAQSLQWPFDPFYANLDGKYVGNIELKSRFLQKVRSLATNATDLQLDWYNYGYQKLDPTKNALYHEGNNTWTLFRPQSLANTIKEVFLVTDPASPQASITSPAGAVGQAELYCFTGSTGLLPAPPPSTGLESLMGFVLHNPQDHSVHIVIRGTQGGSPLYQQFGNKTHPDWASNLSILVAIAAKDPTVAKLYVSGHSLGGALATFCASALTIGQFGADLRNNPAFTNWQWQNLELITFSSPPVGNYTFVNALNASVKNRRIWISGDLVVEFQKAKVGAVVPFLAGTGYVSDLYHPGQAITLDPTWFEYPSERHSLPNVRETLLKFIIANNLIPNGERLPPGAVASAAGPTLEADWVRRWEKAVPTPRFTIAPIQQHDVLKLTTNKDDSITAILNYLNIVALVLNEEPTVKEGDKDQLADVIVKVVSEDNPGIVAAVSTISSPDLKGIVAHAADWQRINKLI